VSVQHAGGSECLDALLYDRVLPGYVVTEPDVIDHFSEADDLCDLIHEDFLRLGFAALRTHALGMSPRSQHPGAGLVEDHDEGIGVRVGEKVHVGSPVGHGRVLVEPGTLQDPTEPVSVGVEDPPAMTRVHGDVSHDDIVDLKPVSTL